MKEGEILQGVENLSHFDKRVLQDVLIEILDKELQNNAFRFGWQWMVKSK